MRIRLLLSLMIAPLAFATSADASLQKYKTRHSVFISAVNTSPTRFLLPAVPPDSDQFGRGVVENAGPPRMKVFTLRNDNTTTVDVPGLSGFIFVSRKFIEGPALDLSGISGDTDSQIAWGNLTGWTVSGENWCNSEPATICTLAGDPDEFTGPARGPSPFYDIGTWLFHGTGFTTVGFIWSRFTTGSPGDNFTYIVRGTLMQDGTVPVLPLAGVVLLGLGVGAVAVGAFRRR